MAMTKGDYSDIVQSLGNVRAAILNKEMTDDGWDLRNEVLALQETVALLARIVYQSQRDGTPSPPPR